MVAPSTSTEIILHLQKKTGTETRDFLNELRRKARFCGILRMMATGDYHSCKETETLTHTRGEGKEALNFQAFLNGLKDNKKLKNI